MARVQSPRAQLNLGPSLCPFGQVEVIGGADKYHSVCRLCYFKKTQPTGADNMDNKENCPALVRPGEAAGVRKLFAPHQIRQCSSAN